MIALTAADALALRGGNPAFTAERGLLILLILLIQSAAYTAARSGDRRGRRELSDEAAAIAAQLDGGTLLRDHVGGFSPATVRLHHISAENVVGEPGAAVDAARTLPRSVCRRRAPRALPDAPPPNCSDSPPAAGSGKTAPPTRNASPAPNHDGHSVRKFSRPWRMISGSPV